MAVTAMKTKSSIDSVRELVQDFLVPELKSLKVEMTSIRNEMAMGFDSIRTEMRLRDEKQAQAIKHLDEKLTQSTHFLSENFRQLSDKVDSSVEFRERLAALEAKSARA